MSDNMTNEEVLSRLNESRGLMVQNDKIQIEGRYFASRKLAESHLKKDG